MGQDDILKLLKKSKEPLSAPQIAKKLRKDNTSVVNTLIRKLLSRREVRFIEKQGQFHKVRHYFITE